MVSFRSLAPEGKRWRQRRGMGRGGVRDRSEGAGGNACASRVWRGNAYGSFLSIVSFPAKSESKGKRSFVDGRPSLRGDGIVKRPSEQEGKRLRPVAGAQRLATDD